MDEPSIDYSPSPGDEVEATTCYMCACRCGIKVWLSDGRIRYIEGNSTHPVNQGVLCAKGSAGIMQHYSPARLDKPLLRVGERGSGAFKEIEWEEALRIATAWLGNIRARNPDELAFFTGRDQSQALTGWWAQQFGTINYAAHGGFCSVNMATAGVYTLGGSFWEFGEPDWEHAQYLMLWGVAEDHDSNPIKLGLSKLKARGAKIVVVNPVRSGYGAIADEWIGIRPGTDGLFAFALIHELLRSDRIDLDYLVRYTNAHWLVIRNPGGADDGLFARDADGKPLCFDRVSHAPRDAGRVDISPVVVGEFRLADGRQAVPVFHLVAERYLDSKYAPAAVSERCGVPVTHGLLRQEGDPRTRGRVRLRRRAVPDPVPNRKPPPVGRRVSSTGPSAAAPTNRASVTTHRPSPPVRIGPPGGRSMRRRAWPENRPLSTTSSRPQLGGTWVTSSRSAVTPRSTRITSPVRSTRPSPVIVPSAAAADRPRNVTTASATVTTPDSRATASWAAVTVAVPSTTRASARYDRPPSPGLSTSPTPATTRTSNG